MTTLNASTTQPKEASYVVYLNGIEIPAPSVTVSMGVGNLPTANITVAPDLNMVQLGKEDRVEVQIFYKDDIHTAVEGKSPDFRLLFDGVIGGWSYVNAARSRSIQFTCVHASEILETLKPNFITGPNSMAMNAYAAVEGTEANFLHSGMTFPWSMYFYGFNTPANKTLIKRPYDFIENVFRSCIDVRHAPELGSVVTSTFYSRYMKKFGLPFRFIPSPIIEIEPLSDPDELGAFPILKAIRSKSTIDAIYRKAAEIGLDQNIWSSIQGIFQEMYYEILSFSTAPIAQVEMTPNSTTRGMVIGPPKWTKPTKKQKSVEENAATKKSLEATLQKKIAEWERANKVSLTAAEKSRIVSVSKASATPVETFQTLVEVAFQEVLESSFQISMTEAEKKRILAQAQANAPITPVRPNFLINHVTKPQWLFGVPPACNVVFPSMIQELRFDEDYLNQPTRLYVNDMSVSEITNTGEEIKKAMTALRYGYPDQVEFEMAKRRGGIGGTRGNPLVSGKNLIVWPEEFYKGPVSHQSVPPGWLHYLNEEFQSNQTVTQQLARKALDEIEQTITNIWEEAHQQAVFQADTAPKSYLNTEEQIKDEAANKEAFNATLLSKLLDEQGVMIQKLQEQKILTNEITSVDDLREELASRANEHQAKLQTLLRMLARYEYHRTRSGLRQGSVLMAFNPYIVPGYPAMIFDYFTNGQHFVGYVTTVTHEMSSRGWQTRIQFVHGQTIDEFVNEVFDSRVGNNPDGVMENVGAGPPTPIPSLRPVLQHVDKAEEYFSQLFHQGATYVRETPTSSDQYDVTGVASNDVLNMRSGPHHKKRIIEKLAYDLKGITKLSGKERSGNSIWWEVMSPSGKSGWVNSRYLAESSDVESAAGVTRKNTSTKSAAFDFTKVLLFIVPGKNKDLYYSFDQVMDAQAKSVQAKRLAQEAKDLQEVGSQLDARMAVIEDSIRLNADDIENNEGSFAEGWTKDSYITAEIARARADQAIMLTELQREKRIRREFSKPEQKLKNKVLDNYVGIRPTRTFAGMFGNHDIAMKYVSRPICTLDQYVAFRGEYGKRRGTIRANHSSQGKGAVYYEQILNLVPDPGDPPTFDENNFLINPKPRDLPDTRKDWTTRLKNYRTKVLFGTLPDDQGGK